MSAGALQGAILSPESYWYFLWKAGMPCYLPIAKCKLPILNCQLLIANCGMRIAYCHLGIFRTLACASGLPLPTLLDTHLQRTFIAGSRFFDANEMQIFLCCHYDFHGYVAHLCLLSQRVWHISASLCVRAPQHKLCPRSTRDYIGTLLAQAPEWAFPVSTMSA